MKNIIVLILLNLEICRDLITCFFSDLQVKHIQYHVLVSLCMMAMLATVIITFFLSSSLYVTKLVGFQMLKCNPSFSCFFFTITERVSLVLFCFIFLTITELVSKFPFFHIWGQDILSPL